MKQDLENNHPQVLVNFLVNAKDRKYPRLTSRAGGLGTKSFKC